jgi:hypothetical protein
MILEITDSSGDSIDVELPDDWVNYWDVNPQQHGGLFTWFGQSGVTVVETQPPSSIPDDVLTESHLVYDYYSPYDELWTTVDGQDQPSEILDRELASLSHCDSLQQAAVDGMLPSAMAWCVTRIHYDRQHTVAADDYADWLSTQYDIPRELL